MPTIKNKFTVIVDDDLLKEIDDFLFENRFRSRSAATVALIQLGLHSPIRDAFEGNLKEHAGDIEKALMDALKED